MKTKTSGIFAIATLLALTMLQPALAADPGEKSSNYGKNIRKVDVSGYSLSYYLLNVVDKHVGVMPNETTSSDFNKMKSHHLMVFITRPNGRPATEGKAGFLVVQPNKTESREIAVAMDGGFGSDVDLPFNGDFTITTKIVLADVDLLDRFVHTVK